MVSHNYLDWAEYQNRYSLKSIWVMRLSKMIPSWENHFGKIPTWSLIYFLNYRKVVSSRLSRLVAHTRIFRRLMKGKFYPYVMWPLAPKFQNWIVDWSNARNFVVVGNKIAVFELNGSIWQYVFAIFFCEHLFYAFDINCYWNCCSGP